MCLIDFFCLYYKIIQGDNLILRTCHNFFYLRLGIVGFHESLDIKPLVPAIKNLKAGNTPGTHAAIGKINIMAQTSTIPPLCIKLIFTHLKSP